MTTIDVDHHISEIDRSVGSRRLEAGEARVLTVSRVYPTDRDDLWDACTNPERIPRWFLPVSGDLTPGGRYKLEGNAEGTVEECDPPHRFTATWEFGGQVSWIEVQVSAESGGRARFTLEHVAHVEDELWAQFGPGAAGVGWDGALMGLALHLESGSQPVDPQAVQEWMASEDGRRFFTESSAGWKDASIAAGTDPADAEAAAQRTTAFYTGAEGS
ncbi:MAG: SRPBCC family protein [Actinomycetota bacterium]